MLHKIQSLYKSSDFYLKFHFLKRNAQQNNFLLLPVVTQDKLMFPKSLKIQTLKAILTLRKKKWQQDFFLLNQQKSPQLRE